MFWYTKYKKKKADEQEKDRKMRREEAETEKSHVETNIAEAKKEMLKKRCMHRNWDYCSDECSYFQEGSVEIIIPYFYTTGRYYQTNYPKCRLWGEK